MNKKISTGAGIALIAVLAGAVVFYNLSGNKSQAPVQSTQSNSLKGPVENHNVAQNPGQTVSKTDETTNWKTYSNDKYNFSLKYPADLGYSENEIPVSVQKKQILENGQGVSVFNLTIAKNAMATVVNSGIVLTVSKRGTEKDPLACNTQGLVSKQETVIDKQKANKCTFKGSAYTDDNKFVEGIANVSYRVTKGDFVYEISSMGTHAENISNVNQIVGSFRFAK